MIGFNLVSFWVKIRGNHLLVGNLQRDLDSIQPRSWLLLYTLSKIGYDWTPHLTLCELQWKNANAQEMYQPIMHNNLCHKSIKRQISLDQSSNESARSTYALRVNEKTKSHRNYNTYQWYFLSNRVFLKLMFIVKFSLCRLQYTASSIHALSGKKPQKVSFGGNRK